MIASVPLAAAGSSSLFLIAVGVIVAALLIAAFWYGSRRAAARKDPGAQPLDQSPPARARQDSWRTPDDTNPDPERRP
ncbi:DUF6479 family protein [Streptomyces sp. G-G2]|uniref:DUF6479 family protein n=1 Tax=Streptomyces sp. G-G2 TaxID=3046201 RepID=UPI0024BBB744|nr:DUF6479 family protein [Streptomyces sp. G-G2]MDJ0382327.1 DUF6479 family protein [Streptomyces sp. G-G2]